MKKRTVCLVSAVFAALALSNAITGEWMLVILESVTAAVSVFLACFGFPLRKNNSVKS